MRAPHTCCRRGKRVRVVMKDGTTFVDKFVERTAGKLCVFETITVRAGDIRAFTILRGPLPMSDDKIVQFPQAPAGGAEPPIGRPGEVALHPAFGDVEAMFNSRDWLRKACEAQGAKFTGGGCGMGASDIDIELQGMRFNIQIKPLP